MVDMLVYMFNLVLISRLVKGRNGRCDGNQFSARNRPKSSTRLPSWDSHSTTDSRMGKRMHSLTAQMSGLWRVKIW